MVKAWEVLLICSLTAGIAACAPILFELQPRPVKAHQAFQQCTIYGNSDFYGLGIRVGIYLQCKGSHSSSIKTSTNYVLFHLVSQGSPHFWPTTSPRNQSTAISKRTLCSYSPCSLLRPSLVFKILSNPPRSLSFSSYASVSCSPYSLSGVIAPGHDQVRNPNALRFSVPSFA